MGHQLPTKGCTGKLYRGIDINNTGNNTDPTINHAYRVNFLVAKYFVAGTFRGIIFVVTFLLWLIYMVVARFSE